MARVEITHDNAAHYVDQTIEAIEDHANKEDVVERRNRRYTLPGLAIRGVTPGVRHEMPLFGRDPLTRQLGYFSLQREMPDFGN